MLFPGLQALKEPYKKLWKKLQKENIFIVYLLQICVKIYMIKQKLFIVLKK